jgi:Xaa-Pro aminopeptidase
MRWKKSEAELALMRRSAGIAAEAMTMCMSATNRSGATSSEHELSALFEYECRTRGAQRMAYPPVVASGSDATTIHYSRNDKQLVPGDLLLVDAGCEYYGYCSDVTRTWPVGGRFEGANRDVYEAVLETHAALLRACVPGNTLRQLHHMSVDMLRDALRSLGLEGDYKTFYPHSVGHWLGMDTHDAPSVSHDLPLEDGVTLTIEPGLYIPDDPRYGHYRGIGVRIEDDVLIRNGGGCDVLSASAPCGPDEIERLTL